MFAPYIDYDLINSEISYLKTSIHIKKAFVIHNKFCKVFFSYLFPEKTIYTRTPVSTFGSPKKQEHNVIIFGILHMLRSIKKVSITLFAKTNDELKNKAYQSLLLQLNSSTVRHRLPLGNDSQPRPLFLSRYL